MYAPITLFVYNRPKHTRRTVEALQKNTLAADSDLIIFSDAQKSESQTDDVRMVRQYIRQVDGFKSVTIVERETNYGLARSIIDGVTKVINERGRIIVLEDDLVTAPYFLSFMNKALDAYQDEDKVMHISGYMFPIDNADMPETFFLRMASCWGWATWNRAWCHFEKNPKKLLSEYTEQTISRFNLDGAYNFWLQIEQNESGLMDSWAVFWYATIFQKGGLCLHPESSMVSNTGHDDSGLHCAKTSKFDVQLASKHISYFEGSLAENVLAIERLKAYFSSAKPPFFSRITQAFRKRFIHNQLSSK